MDIISKVIYYCWFGGEKSEKVINCINNWKEKLPYYEIVEINEYNKELFDVEKECQNNLWFKTVWENKMWAYVADYARLKVLYERGGVYFDTDIIVEKDITELLKKQKLIMGWEHAQSIACGVIICPQKDKNIKLIFDFYSNQIWEMPLYTIPQITTYILKNNYSLKTSAEITENDDIFILPTEYFYPLPIGIKEKEGYITPNTYTIHWWDASWLTSNIHYFLKNKHKVPLKKLLKKCFKKVTIINSDFLKITLLFKEINLNINFDYTFKFRYRYSKNKKSLILIFLGIPIKLWDITTNGN